MLLLIFEGGTMKQYECVSLKTFTGTYKQHSLEHGMKIYCSEETQTDLGDIQLIDYLKVCL